MDTRIKATKSESQIEASLSISLKRSLKDRRCVERKTEGNWSVKLFSWLLSQQQSRRDRSLLEVRTRSLLISYLSADEHRKQSYYQVVAGAAAACSPDVTDPSSDATQNAKAAAQRALQVVKSRVQKRLGGDELQSLITDAYAVVAVASSRAAMETVGDREVIRLGTAAVHLVTIANSYMQKKVDEES